MSDAKPAGRFRRRAAVLAPFVPLVLLLVAMGATQALARGPNTTGPGFHAASAEMNASLGLRPSAACHGLLTAASIADAPPSADLGCTHGLDLYGTTVDGAAAPSTASALPPIATPPGIPCYSTGPYVKVFYIYDKNGASKLSQRKPLIREIVAQADKVVNDSAGMQGAERHVRWLMTSACKLKVVPVAADLSLDVISLRVNLRSRGLLSGTQKGLAFTEAGAYGCAGIAEVYGDDRATSSNRNNTGGMLALVYAGCWTSGEEVITGTEVATHELTHTLGAVQLSAPNSTPQFHCTDESDVMCYDDGTGLPMRNVCPAFSPERLDCGRNDYFNTSPAAGTYIATHWNTANSAYLSSADPGAWDRLARPTVTLSGPSGTVSGKVTYTADATAPTGSKIAQVIFVANGQEVGVDNTAPFTLQLDTLPEHGGWGNGRVLNIKAYAVDSFYRWASSSVTKATVGNPKVRLLSPTEYDYASGDMPWSAKATAGKGRTIASVELIVNGAVKDTDTTAPYGGTFNVRNLYSADVQVRVTDSAGAKRTSVTRNITVMAPTVDLLQPSYWAYTFADDGILLAASATAAPGVGLDRVEFLVGGVKVGEDTTAPYTYLYDTSGLANGSIFNVKARAVDARGHAVASSVSQVEVEHLTATATLTAPAAGAALSGMVSLSADISVPAGTDVWDVTFLVDGQAVAYVYSAPWEATWDANASGFPNGPHVISVQADVYDGLNSFVVQSPGTIITLSQPETTVTLTSPLAHQVKGKVTLTASVDLAPGDDVYYVEFYAGPVWLGWDDTAPYQATWDSAGYQDGTLPLRAVAWSTYAGEVSSDIATVQLANLWARPAQPAAGAVVSGSITLKAQTHRDGEAVLEQVKFLIDGKVVKTDWAGPYSVAWNSASIPNGTHYFKVKLITTDGRAKTSFTRSFTVAN